MNGRLSILNAILAPQVRQSCWEWACANVDFALDKKYRAASPGKYNPALMPFMREPMEALYCAEIKELSMVKPSQSGGSEHVILMPMRREAAEGGRAMLYVSGQQEKTEEFFVERIKRGMGVTAITRDLAKKAVERGLVYEIGAAQIVCTWSRSGAGLKQRPFDWCFGDEVSSWPDVSIVDEMRKRMATRPFPKLVLISTPDARQKRPSSEDPIFIEYLASDRREWLMRDPVTGNRFRFEMGAQDTVHGLKWDHAAKRQDDTWDLEAVEATAYYMTPDGTRIDNKDRLAVVATGEWVPGNPSAPAWRRGYRFNQFLLPFECGNFGHIARRFVESNLRGAESLKAFIYEVLAEEWVGRVDSVPEQVVMELAGQHKRGEKPGDNAEMAEKYGWKGKPSTVYVTVDVQKVDLWWVCRQWFEGGDSALIDWGRASDWGAIDTTAKKYGAMKILIDNSYPVRQQEVKHECVARIMIPCYGRDNLSIPIVVGHELLNEGIAGDQNIKLGKVTWRPSDFKHLVVDRMREHGPRKWLVTKAVDREYLQQVTAERCVDGEWQQIRKANHLWDCECLQLLAATIDGLERTFEALPEREKGDKEGQDK